MSAERFRPASSPQEELSGITRRGFLESAKEAAKSVTAIGAIGTGLGAAAYEYTKPRFVEYYPGRKLELFAHHGEPMREPRLYRMGTLADRRATGLTHYYFGHEGEIRAQEPLSFKLNLHEMWDEKTKLNRSESAETRQFGDALVKEYAALRDNAQEGLEPDFESYLGKMTNLARELVESIEPTRLHELYGFEGADGAWDLKMLLHLASRINGNVLAAYSMTEIMPGGVDVYRFLLENAGTEFLLRIPSLYDALVSFGMFQFTKFALDVQERHGKPQYRYAALANQALPEDKRIPDTVEELMTLRDHAGAAILYNVHNLAVALRSLRRRHPGKAGDYYPQKISEMDERTLTQLLAANHTLPTTAHGALIGWAEGGERPFISYCPAKGPHGREGLYTYVSESGKHFDEIARAVPGT